MIQMYFSKYIEYIIYNLLFHIVFTETSILVIYLHILCELSMNILEFLVFRNSYQICFKSYLILCVTELLWYLKSIYHNLIKLTEIH